MEVYIMTNLPLYARYLQQVFHGIDYDAMSLLHDFTNNGINIPYCFISTSNGLIKLEIKHYVNSTMFVLELSYVLTDKVFMKFNNMDSELLCKLFNWLEDYMEE